MKYRDEVERLTKKNKESYRRAYAFLRAAAALEEERYKEVIDCVDKEKLAKQAKEIGDRVGKSEEVQSRRLFLDAISCKGRVSFAEALCENNRVYRILGAEKDVVTDLLAKAVQSDRKELFCSPLRPQCVRHMLLRDRDFFLTTATGTEGTLLSSEDFLKRACDKIAEVYFREARHMEAEAMHCLKECKKIHDALEEIYKECVDFTAISERTEGLLALLEEL